MSVDTIAYIQISGPAPTAAELLAVLRSNCPYMERLRSWIYDSIARHRSTPIDREWRIHQRPERQSVCSAHLCVDVATPSLLEFWFGWRHPHFAEPEIREMFRLACSELATLCRTSTAVYVPEIGNYDASGDLHRLTRSLREHYGEPANDLDDLVARAAAARDYWHPGCYYIDQLPPREGDNELSRAGA